MDQIHIHPFIYAAIGSITSSTLVSVDPNPFSPLSDVANSLCTSIRLVSVIGIIINCANFSPGLNTAGIDVVLNLNLATISPR